MIRLNSSFKQPRIKGIAHFVLSDLYLYHREHSDRIVSPLISADNFASCPTRKQTRFILVSSRRFSRSGECVAEYTHRLVGSCVSSTKRGTTASPKRDYAAALITQTRGVRVILERRGQTNAGNDSVGWQCALFDPSLAAI